MTRRVRIWLLVVAALLPAIALCAPKQPTVGSLKKERGTVQSEIKQTQRKLEDNKRNVRRQLQRLDRLNAEIGERRRDISGHRARVDSVERAITTLNDTIAQLEQRIVRLREAYAATLRRMQGHDNATGRLAFILSAETFNNAWQRIRYLRYVDRHRRAREQELAAAIATLDAARLRADTLATQHRNTLQRLELATRSLEKSRTQADAVVRELNNNAAALQAHLAEQQKRQRALDAQIDRLIAEEARKKGATGKKESAKPAPGVAGDNAEGAAFRARRGQLAAPVSGSYTIARPFGRQQHPQLAHVVTENSGIDLRTAAGAKARAVHAGTVSAIFTLEEGYGAVIMVRHGNYITIYGGIEAPTVTNGAHVEAGQTLGTVITAPDADAPVLHFEIRREREKLDPTPWIKR